VKIIELKSENKLIYRAYGNDKLPFKTINQFLVFQQKRGRTPNTIKSQGYDLTTYFRYLSEYGKSWLEVGIDEWVDFIQYLKMKPTHQSVYLMTDQTGSARSATTINRHLSTLNSFYKYQSAKNGINMPKIHECIRNPFCNDHVSFLSFAGKSRPKALNTKSVIGRQKVCIARPKVITNDDQKRLLEACRNRRDRLLILLLHETGLRIGQALGLKHEDIASWRQKIVVNYRDDNPNKAFAKSQDMLEVHISNQWLDLYTDYLISDLDEVDSDYVFCNLYNKTGADKASPLSYSTVKALFRRISKHIGKDITPHMLRHTHATELLRSGVSIELVAKRLGHKSIETTRSIYEHLTAEDLKNEIDRQRNR